MNKIIKKERIAPQVTKFVVNAPDIANKRQAGQFVILRLSEEGERIPLTIADANPEQGTITIVSQEVGKTTAILSQLQEGEQILDLVGPLGKPTHLKNSAP